MEIFAIPDYLKEQVEAFLSRSQPFPAVVLLVESTGCNIGAAKRVVGERFRVQFPELWSTHRNIGDDD